MNKVKFFFSDLNRLPIFGNIEMLINSDKILVVGGELGKESAYHTIKLSELVGFDWGLYIKDRFKLRLTDKTDSVYTFIQSYTRAEDIPNFADMYEDLMSLGDIIKFEIQPGQYRVNLEVKFKLHLRPIAGW